MRKGEQATFFAVILHGTAFRSDDHEETARIEADKLWLCGQTALFVRGQRRGGVAIAEDSVVAIMRYHSMHQVNVTAKEGVVMVMMW